ncbi:BBE domain-containing protein, partial [Streptomyces sp. NPDC001922]|uniref:BBE domain-containing protein n=1 Tax=Streptomyces sp. NPDC001922 TaxID=3364624 RepID=UPI00369ABDA4
LMVHPDLPFVAEPLRGRYVAHIRIAHTGSALEGRKLVAPLKAVAPRLTDSLRDMPYTAAGSVFEDPVHPHGYAGDNVLLSSLDPADLRAVVDIAGPQAPVMCVVDLRHLGGALTRPQGAPNAIGHRDAAYILRVLSPVGPWQLDEVVPAHEKLLTAVAPRVTGSSGNFVYGAGRPVPRHRMPTLYDPGVHERLTRLKALHDPDNTFRVNHNIQP